MGYFLNTIISNLRYLFYRNKKTLSVKMNPLSFNTYRLVPLMIILHILIGFKMIEESFINGSLYLGVGLYVYYLFYKYKNKTVNYLFSINKRLVDLFLSYKFYEVNEELDIKIYSPVSFWVSKDLMELEIYFPIGTAKYSQEFRELDLVLQDIFNMNLVRKEDKKGQVIYFLSNRNDSIKVDSADCLENSTYKIPLSSSMTWDYSKYPHGLVTGSTGSGKTYFLSYIVQTLMEQQATVKICDPKMSDLYQMGLHLNLDSQYSINGIDKILRLAVEEMERRQGIMFGEGSKGFGLNYLDYNLPPYFVLFDEVGAFMSRAETENKTVANSVKARLNNIVLMGRQLGIFIILSTQRPDAKYISGDIRDNLSLRLALGSMSDDGKRMVFGSEGKDLILGEFETGKGFIFLDGTTLTPIPYKTPKMAKMFFK